MTVFKLEKAEKGPGTFRCLPLLEENKDYNRLIKHTIRNTLVEVSLLSNIDKAAAIKNLSDFLAIFGAEKRTFLAF